MPKSSGSACDRIIADGRKYGLALILTSQSERHLSAELQLTLTLSTPADLKVREGDRIESGQILSDRVRDRQRLEAQKRQIQMERLSQLIAGAAFPRPIPEVAGLPPASFLGEVADVERSRLLVEAAERILESQQRKLDLLQSLPSCD